MTVSSFALHTAFFISALLTIGGALCVVLLPNLIHCAFFLALSLLGVAGLFMLADAPFLAVVQVMVYVGGVVLLILFAIMLAHRMRGRGERQFNRQSPLVFILVLAFLALLIPSLWLPWPPPRSQADTTPLLANQILSNYLLPLEILGLVFLLSAIGALVLAREDK